MSSKKSAWYDDVVAVNAQKSTQNQTRIKTRDPTRCIGHELV